MTSNIPSISVVVPSHNDERHIEACLDSLLGQTLKPSEIVVCDDASTDGTRSVVRDWQRRHPDVSLLLVPHDEHVGIPRNFNSGLLASSGEYVSMLAADDYWEPPKLEMEYRLIVARAVRWAYSKVELQFDDRGSACVRQPFPGTSGDFDGDIFLNILHRQVSPRSFLIERRALLDVGLFDETIGMYEDWDLKMRLAKAYPVAHVTAANVIYRQHGGGEHHAPMYRHMAEISKVLRKCAALLNDDDAALRRSILEQFWPETAMPTERDKAARETALASLALPYNPASIGAGGEGLIFLVSLPRSGSTMLQRVLGGHPDIHTAAEPWVMLNPLYALKRDGVSADYDAGMGRRALEEFLDELPGDEQNYYDAVRQLGRTLYSRAVRAAGKSRFLDKTPRYFYVMPELMRTFPKARFVLLVRHPLAVLASVLRTWFNNDVQAFESSTHHKDMLEGPRLLCEAMEAAGDNLLVTRYEDIVRNPDTEIRRLCDFLEIPFFAPMLSYGDRPAPTGTLGDPENVNRQAAPVAAFADAWKRAFDTPELRGYALAYVERTGGDVLDKLGYPAAHMRELLSSPEPAANAVALNAAGEQAFKNGDSQGAEEKFRAAHALDSHNVEVCNNLVVLYWERGDSQQALHYLEHALQLDGKDRNVVINGGQILMSFGCVDEATGLYATYLEDNPGDSEVRALLNQATADDAGEADSAVRQQSAIADKPEHGSIPGTDYTVRELAARAPRISVVIPSFNQGRYLETTIRSVLDQNYPNLELIVMDGGSTDESVEIIKKYRERINYWQSQPDGGQYWAVDEGFRRSSGELMTWINSDDKLHPKSLNTMASIFTQRTDVEWVTGTPNVMNEQGFITWICDPAPVFSHRNYLQKKYDFPTFIQQEGTFWRRSLWEKAGASLQTELQMAGDLELWARFFRYAALYTTTACSGCFRQQKNQKTAKAMALYHEEAGRILDREIAQFGASGRVPVAPVEPLDVQWGRPCGQAVPGLARALKPLLAAGAERLRTYSALPGARPTANPASTMHGARPEPLVTAIVSTYNSEKYLRGCLDDLEAQSLAARLEIIVVDSGSSENEAAVVREYQSRYSNIHYIRTEARETIYSAWNRAISAARGKYLTNANTDDRHRHDAFESMVRMLEADPGLALVYADSAVTAEENARFEDAPVTGWFRWPEFDARQLFSVCYIGPQPMWRRALHEKYGHFDPRMRVAGDYDFWLRMAPYERFQHIPETLGLYLDSKASIEHAFAGTGAEESERARERNWPDDWGQRPPLTGGYLVAAGEQNGPRSDSAGAREAVTDAGAPLVSVVMATKDRREMLACALASVTRQSYRHWEIVLVNDGGVDVEDIVEGLGPVRVSYLQNAQSLGQAQARNMALQAASGDIVTFLDDDDLYLPNHLQTVVDAFGDQSCVFAYTDADLVQEVIRHGERREISRSAPYRHAAWSRRRLHIDNYIPINTWAVRKACLDKVGGFDESLACCEDWELLLRIARQYDFAHIVKTTVEVRHRADVTDNVTRQRLGETEAVYRIIYARYDAYAGQAAVEEERSNALRQLREKLANLHDAADPASQGETDSGAEPRDNLECQRFLERTTREGYHCPAIHLFALVGENDVQPLCDTLEALAGQYYSGWGLTVISALASPAGAFEELPMLEWQQVADPASGLHEAMRTSVGEWLGVLNPGDRPAANALSTVVDYINLNPDWKFIYADESVAARDGARQEVYFKPDCNFDYLLAYPYLGNFCLARKEIQSETATGLRHVQSINLDLCLGAIAAIGEDCVGHIAEVLNQRLPTASDAAGAGSLHAEYEAAISRFLRSMQMEAELLGGLLPNTFMLDYRLSGRPEVCIAIYGVGVEEKAADTVASVLNKTGYREYKVRVAAAHGAAAVFSAQPDPRVQIDCVDAACTRSDYLNAVAAEQGTEYLLFIEPGALAVQDVWLERMLAHAARPDVGALGVRLVSPEQRVVHGGIITGVGSFAAGSIVFQGQRMDAPGYMNRALVPQDMAAVSSGCMLTRTQVFLQAGGFDQAIDVPLYQDIDLCQRLRARGRKVVWTPWVTLLYVGADLGAYRGERGLPQVVKDAETLGRRWLPSLARDPAYNRNLGLKEPDFTLDRHLPPAWNPDIHDLPRVVGFGTGSYGSWQYRAYQPMKALRDAGRAHCVQTPFIHKNMILLPTPAEIERIRPDALLMHNTLHDDCIEALAKYKKVNRAFVVFGQDDLMFALPPKNPFSKTVYKDIKKRLRRCLSLADRLLVTTDALADGLRSMSDDIRVLPNYLDDSVWQGLSSERNVSRKLRVGWAGAQQHLGDLEMIEQVVRDTAEEVDWVFFGMCPDCLRPYVREVHDAVRFESYPEQLAALNLDLAVAPLEHNRFNEAKSNLRLLEYGVLGWPVVASDIEPYRDAPVCRVPNQPRAWINAIRERVHDVESAWREGDRLRNWVRENWMLSQHLTAWEEVLGQPQKAPANKVGNRLATA